MSEFEIGDKVKLVDKIDGYFGAEVFSPSWYDLSIGDTFTIVDIGNDMDDNFLEFKEIDALFHKDHFEKVEQEFEVVYRVRVNGDSGTIVSLDDVNDPVIEFDSDGDYWSGIEPFPTSAENLELISKGSEPDMQDVDAIAVEVDNKELSKAIQREAFSKNWEWVGTPVTGIHENYSKIVFVGDKRVLASESTGDYENIGKLSENWNKVVEFLEQEDDEPDIEVAGREVVFNEDSIEIGCQTISNETLKTVQEFREEMADESLHVGTMEFKGHDVTETQLNDIIEYQLDDVSSSDIPF